MPENLVYNAQWMGADGVLMKQGLKLLGGLLTCIGTLYILGVSSLPQEVAAIGRGITLGLWILFAMEWLNEVVSSDSERDD